MQELQDRLRENHEGFNADVGGGESLAAELAQMESGAVSNAAQAAQIESLTAQNKKLQNDLVRLGAPATRVGRC